MAPSKSVTAVIGVSRLPRNCTVQGCEVCAATALTAGKAADGKENAKEISFTMDILQELQNRILFCDGGMGSLLQEGSD